MVISLAAALRDPKLLGRSFGQASHFGWHALAALISGEELDPFQTSFLLKWSGRTRLPRVVRRFYGLIGRRGGKSRFDAAVAVWRAALAADWRAECAPGEIAVAALVAVDREQARVLMSYVEGLLRDSPVLSEEVTRYTQSVIEFRSGGCVQIMANNPHSIRGRTIIGLFGDEASLWETGADGVNDEELLVAILPAMATVRDGGLVCLTSTTWHKRGLMFKKFTELHGRDDVDELCLLAPSRAFNPSLSLEVIAMALRQDPIRARAEYLSEWRTDETDFIPRDIIEMATDWGCRERPPVPGVKYTCFGDVATGTGKDSIALGIAHEERGVYVLDGVRHAGPPFSPEGFITTWASWVRSYGCDTVYGDRIGEWCRTYFAKGGLKYYFSPTRSEIYIAWLPQLLAGQGRLIDHEELRGQAAGLERRVMAGGREEVNHGKSASAHDDIVNVAAGAMIMAQRLAANRMTFTPPPDLSIAAVQSAALYGTPARAGPARTLATPKGTWARPVVAADPNAELRGDALTFGGMNWSNRN
jgi:hypothetical protein